MATKVSFQQVATDRRFSRTLMHAEDARFVFVRLDSGHWIRTDACVAICACPMCKSGTGEPCRDKRGEYKSATHFPRKYAATAKKRERNNS